ncbi:TetR/AcrR family transcriptional regulator [Mycobacterium sherrisii]|uniref:TetR family transcriptional regulator n=1 Tax=Mycobacterium sherrisii TaxID=243061 RepID=A0A1E3STR2_9MYCO|nr:TetR/AcrR family transcriptional regulator [Mycobacterium sherrisii]MCV7028829.1 TetR/AcrR family transcriptional regulator [Mycobacterium sherrisii]MEC4761761.1 TetR/AcrR family transcriptional regulator [Mycobacterium sherrisii]ODR05544.1 TetR family transcriptional regulator [Mycobacterium sherrisii]ORW82632.1 TetR family transcriptional regulator [Mycobacterium sherrisii]
MDSQVQKFTRKGAATRRRIIEGAAEEIRTNGVVLTTLDNILARTQTSKSQLFHYFPGGREDLLLAVVQYEADLVMAEQQPYLGELTSWAGWQRWRDAVVERYRYRARCRPNAVLMSDLGRTSPDAQAIIAAAVRQWRGEVAKGIRNMQDQGKIDRRVDAERSAAALLAGIQGGAGMLLTIGDATFLEAAIDGAINALRTAGT